MYRTTMKSAREMAEAYWSPSMTDDEVEENLARAAEVRFGNSGYVDSSAGQFLAAFALFVLSRRGGHDAERFAALARQNLLLALEEEAEEEED